MTNDIKTTNPAALAAFGSLRASISQTRAAMPAAVGGTPYLRLLRDGTWAMGADDSQIAEGTEAIINPLSIQQGYSCWTNRGPKEGKNEKLGEEMWKVTQAKPAINTLPAMVDPRTQANCSWKDQMAFELKFLDGNFEGQQALFSTTSVGGLRLVDTVLGELERKLDTGSEYVFPIVRIGVDSYQHASYGKTYTPLMDVIGWANMHGDEEGDDKPAAAPAAKPEPAPEPEPAPQEAPAGRRRRV
jgi:hypothetical protein